MPRVRLEGFPRVRFMARVSPGVGLAPERRRSVFLDQEGEVETFRRVER
jgi:hypothetical protein